MKALPLSLFLLFATVAGLCRPVTAAAGETELPVLEIGAGIGALALPEYLGSDEELAYAAPIPWFVYRGERFRADRNGLQGLFYTGDGIRLDLSLSGSVPVDSEENAARKGMDDLDPGLQIGPSLNIDLMNRGSNHLEGLLRVRGLFSFDGLRSAYEGWVFNPVLLWKVQPSDNLKWGYSLRGYYGDASFHDYYYGVAPEFATPARPAYKGESGFGGISARISVDANLNKNWQLLSSLSWNDIHDSAFDESPLVQQQHGVFFSVFLTRTLWRSERTTGNYRE